MTLPWYLSAKMQVAAADKVRSDIDALTLKILQDKVRREPSNARAKAALAAFKR